MSPSLRLVLIATWMLAACATAPADAAREAAAGSNEDPTRSRAVKSALAQLGAPYRYGGSTPKGFDCSGLVVYAYGQAGVSGLPRSASALQRHSEAIELDELQPGDLLFFDLGQKKTSHVGLYVGDRTFVHAPSSGKRVELVRFDHVYWSKHLGSAGRLH